MEGGGKKRIKKKKKAKSVRQRWYSGAELAAPAAVMRAAKKRLEVEEQERSGAGVVLFPILRSGPDVSGAGGVLQQQIRRSVIQSSASSAAELAKETTKWGPTTKAVSQNTQKAKSELWSMNATLIQGGELGLTENARTGADGLGSRDLFNLGGLLRRGKLTAL